MSKLLLGHANDQPKASKMICQKWEAKEQWRNRWADDSEWQHYETISKWISKLVSLPCQSDKQNYNHR